MTNSSLRLCVLGPGRAGLALAIAAVEAGHTLAGLVGRNLDHLDAALERAEWKAEGVARLGISDALPDCDLLIIAVRDGEIADVAAHLASSNPNIAAAVHLSGLRTVAVLAPLAAHGTATGAFHPLQTLPTPRAGATRLRGAHAGITAGDDLTELLRGFAASLGMPAFHIADENKPLYHAAAAAAANFPVAAFAMSEDLFAAAGVPLEAARPLVEAIVDNVFDLGPRPALTGPVARGDVETVVAQLRAVADSVPEWLPGFASFVAELARLTGRSGQFAAVADDLGVPE